MRKKVLKLEIKQFKNFALTATESKKVIGGNSELVDIVEIIVEDDVLN